MKRVAELAVDVAGLAGAALITDGVWQIYQPAAFIVAGAFLLAGAWLVARRGPG
jgi:hypothetical protein